MSLVMVRLRSVRKAGVKDSSQVCDFCNWVDKMLSLEIRRSRFVGRVWE